MCRLIAITSKEPLSPMVAVEALNVMREGHDGSGVGLFLRDLSGPFEEMKEATILSGIFTEVPTGLSNEIRRLAASVTAEAPTRFQKAQLLAYVCHCRV